MEKIKLTYEIDLFRKIRNFSDGIDFLDFRINLDLYDGDHKPSFIMHLIILNWTILEFSIYNIYHQNENNSWLIYHNKLYYDILIERMCIMIPRYVDIDAEYYINVNDKDILTDGEVSVCVSEVLDMLDYDDVIDYYNIDMVRDVDDFDKLIDMNNDVILEYLKDEVRRGCFSSMNIDKLKEIVNGD